MATEIAERIEKEIRFTIDKMENCLNNTILKIRLTEPYKSITKAQDLNFPLEPHYD